MLWFLVSLLFVECRISIQEVFITIRMVLNEFGDCFLGVSSTDLKKLIQFYQCKQMMVGGRTWLFFLARNNQILVKV